MYIILYCIIFYYIVLYSILFYHIVLYHIKINNIILFYIIFLNIWYCVILYYIFLVLVNIYIYLLIYIYIISIMITQNYATVPYLFIVIILSRTHTWLSKSSFVEYEVHCTCHVQARSADCYIFCYSFFATLLKFLLNFPRIRHATLL